jgi:hypothetical protein
MTKARVNSNISRIERNRRHMVVQCLELTGVGFGQQVAPQGEHLAELLKYRTEIFQRGAYLYGARSHARPQQPVTP